MEDRMTKWIWAPLTLAILIVSTGCTHKKPPVVDFNRELPPGQLALRKISPGEYPDFSKCTWNLALLPRAIDNSIAYLDHPSAQKSFPYLDISHDRALATLTAFKEVIDTASREANPGQYIDQRIRAQFDVYKSIGAPKPDGPGFTDRVLFTGYCTPIYDASASRHGPYQWPLYKRPKDLAADPITGETVGRKNPDGSITPYYTRAQIERDHKLAGQEFLFLKSRFEAYIVTVQGSARLRMDDGRTLEIGYAGHNGHEYESPGLAMVRDGAIAKEDLNLKTLAAYFAAHPESQDKYLYLNNRTVFFTDRPGGPFGALNVPVTTSATIATDKTLDKTVNMTVYPRAMPAFLSVDIPRTDNPTQKWHFTGFMMDQDTGGAIRAAGRCDIYMGIGPQAEQAAGHQLSEGELYYIAVKQ
jgi:peptidoglycan lytic transglycosylase A